MKIAIHSSTVLRIPVTSRKAALIRTIAAFITKDRVQVTIKGAATIGAVLFCRSFPFGKTLPGTMEQVAGSFIEERSE